MMLHQLSGVFAGMSFGFVVKKPEKSKVQLPISGCSSLRQKDHKLKSLAIRLRGPLSPQTGGKWRRSKPGRRRSRPGAAPHVHWHLGGQGMSLSAKDKEKLSGFFSQFLGPGRKQERQRKGRAGSAKATAQIRTAKTPSKRGIREASCSAAPLLRLCSKTSGLQLQRRRGPWTSFRRSPRKVAAAGHAPSGKNKRQLPGSAGKSAALSPLFFSHQQLCSSWLRMRKVYKSTPEAFRRAKVDEYR